MPNTSASRLLAGGYNLACYPLRIGEAKRPPAICGWRSRWADPSLRGSLVIDPDLEGQALPRDTRYTIVEAKQGPQIEPVPL